MSNEHMVRMALDYGYVSEQQVQEAEAEARALADRGVQRSVLFVLEDLGHLRDEHMRRLRRKTSSAHVRALVVEDYVLQGRVGTGGMGEVFRGERDDGEAVAIKLLPQRMLDTEEYLGRFRREARILGKLVHPNITAFKGAGLVEGRPYFMMELVLGQSLKRRIDEAGAMPARDVLIMMRQMADALRFAWQFGVVHRDVKPSNIILGGPRSHGEPFCAKLCDFGLAKTVVRLDDESHSLTKSGMAVGTPHYMSPEVATGADVLEPCIDIYSLGATAYHALTGKTLYTGKSSAVIMYKQATARMDVRDLAADQASPRLRQLLGDMLAKDRRDRIGDWDTVLTRIDGLLASESDPDLQADVGAVSRGRPAMRPWAMAHLSLILSTLVFLIAAVLLIWLKSGADRTVLEVLPGRFAADLRRATELLAQGTAVQMDLQPGRYQAPWDFRAEHSGLVLRADGPGVVLQGPPDLDRPLLRVGPACRDLRLHGIGLSGGATASMVVGGGAAVQLGALSISDTPAEVLVVEGGSVVIRGLEARSGGGIVLRPASSLRLLDGALTSDGPLIDARDAHLDLERCRLHSAGTEVPSAVTVIGGSLLVRRVLLDVPGAAVGCTLEDCEPVRLADVHISGAQIGMRLHNAVMQEVRGLTVQAREAGIVWSGPWVRDWRWHDQRIEAPTPLRGVELAGLPVDGSGADAELGASLPRIR